MDAIKLFIKETGIKKEKLNTTEFQLMLEDETKAEMERVKTYKYYTALGIACERMINWFKIGNEYNIEPVYSFIASHRRACCYCVLLRKFIDETMVCIVKK